MKEKLRAAQRAAESFRLRSLEGKIVKLRDQGNVYGDKIPAEELEALLDEIVDSEYLRQWILEMASEKPISCKQMSERMRIPPDRILREIVVLRRKNLLVIHGIEGVTPLYLAAK
jgi:hypothetical protein